MSSSPSSNFSPWVVWVQENTEFWKVYKMLSCYQCLNVTSRYGARLPINRPCSTTVYDRPCSCLFNTGARLWTRNVQALVCLCMNCWHLRQRCTAFVPNFCRYAPSAPFILRWFCFYAGDAGSWLLSMWCDVPPRQIHDNSLELLRIYPATAN